MPRTKENRVDQIEGILQVFGLGFIVVVLGTSITRMLLGLRQPAGRSVGQTAWLRSSLFYLIASVIFFGICAVLWKPLPISFSIPWHGIMLVGGVLLLSGGLSLYAWGMFSLGKMHSGSTSMGAQLYLGHKLVTSGPYRYVRHPMYLGIMIAPFGGLLLFHNWTMLLVSLGFLFLPRRARREEQALAAEFGKEWQEYARKVPAFLPNFFRKPGPVSQSNIHR